MLCSAWNTIMKLKVPEIIYVQTNSLNLSRRGHPLLLDVTAKIRPSLVHMVMLNFDSGDRGFPLYRFLDLTAGVYGGTPPLRILKPMPRAFQPPTKIKAKKKSFFLIKIPRTLPFQKRLLLTPFGWSLRMYLLLFLNT